jgi:hypothetical protein
MTSMISRTVWRALVGTAAFLVSNAALAGEITGKVSDLKDGPIRGTTVWAFNLDTLDVLRDAANKPIQDLTDEKGNFRLTVPDTSIGLQFTKERRVDVTLRNINGNLGGTINVFQPEVETPTYSWYQQVPCTPAHHHRHGRRLKFWH